MTEKMTEKYGMTNEKILERYANLSVDDYKDLLAEVKRLKAKLFEAELWVNNDSYTFENSIKELNDYAVWLEE
jgi:FMN phosphatase YigB (HAD superfamily)